MSKKPEVILPPITFDELMRRIEDVSIPSEELSPYLILVPDPAGSINPIFQPNPSLVTDLTSGLEGGVLVSNLNRRERRIRNKRFADKIADGWAGLRLVDEGDSWFQYPLNLFGMRDIVDHLSAEHAVYSLSGAGHLLSEMIHQNETIEAISRVQPHALILSAGGNDLFDNGNIANLVERVPGGVVLGDRFDTFLHQIIGEYRDFLMSVHRAFPQLLMLIHGYSAAFSRGDRWIGRPLSKVGIKDEAAQNEIVRRMLERFNEAQITLAAEPRFEGKLNHVDLRDLGRNPDGWWDEIHMDGEQNRKAATLFTEALKEHGAGGGLEIGDATTTMAEPPVQANAVAAHARQLTSLSEGMLMAELQARLDLIERNPEAAELPSAPLQVLVGGLEGGDTPSSGPLAHRLLRRWERELCDLLCGEAEEDTDQRKNLREALGLDPELLIGFIAGWLISGPLGLSALLAGVIAAILVKRIGSATAEELCVAWQERLNRGT